MRGGRLKVASRLCSSEIHQIPPANSSDAYQNLKDAFRRYVFKINGQIKLRVFSCRFSGSCVEDGRLLLTQGVTEVAVCQAIHSSHWLYTVHSRLYNGFRKNGCKAHPRCDGKS